VPADPTNPGQFFACCGLLELADRLSPGAAGWFSRAGFHLAGSPTLQELLTAIRDTRFTASAGGGDVESDWDDAVPVFLLDLAAPFGLRLGWWGEERGLKTWAGSMRVELIAAAMSHAIDPACPDPLNQATVVFDPPPKRRAGVRPPKPTKREPFYFDSRRASNAHVLDVGFSANDLGLQALAYPAVEFLCLVGLERCRPRPVGPPRTFTFWDWTWPVPVPVLPVAVSGELGDPSAVQYRFESVFRSGQRKHKAFGPATRVLPERAR
jgi:CRISPR-associated protein Csb3